MSHVPLPELLNNPWDPRLLGQLSDILKAIAEEVPSCFEKLVRENDAKPSDSFSIVLLDPTRPGSNCRPLAAIGREDGSTFFDQAVLEACVYAKFGRPHSELMPYQLTYPEQQLTTSVSTVLGEIIAASAGLDTLVGNKAMADFALRRFIHKITQLFGSRRPPMTRLGR